MKRKEIACMICVLLLIITLLNYRYGLICLGEPFIAPVITYMVADEYYSAVNVPYHDIGSRELNQEQAEGAEWKGPFFSYNEPRAYVIDSQEEFETKYAAHGIDGTYAEAFDYTENILVLSINYRIDRIYALEKTVTWKEELPYILPEFSYRNKREKGMIYYYEVPRMQVQYEKDDEVYTTKLHLSNPVYRAEQKAHINFFPIFKKWGWAFDKVN